MIGLMRAENNQMAGMTVSTALAVAEAIAKKN